MTQTSFLKYKLPQSRDSDPPHFLEVQAQIIGSNNVDLQSFRGTKVTILQTREGKVVVHVFQWQKIAEGSAISPTRCPIQISSASEEAYEDSLWDDLAAASETPEKMTTMVIDVGPPARLRAHHLVRALQVEDHQPVNFMAVHAWETWDYPKISGGVLHMMDSYGGPPFGLEVLAKSILTRQSPEIVVIPPDSWGLFRLWFPEAHTRVRTLRTQPSHPVVPPTPPFQRYYDQLSQALSPTYRRRSYSTLHRDHHDAYRFLLREGKGKLGSASAEAWSQATIVAPHFKTILSDR